jgi:hypothetical protein
VKQAELISILKENHYSFKIDGDVLSIIHQGNVYLESLTTLPTGTVFNNEGNVYLHSLTTLPAGTVFNNQGCAYLNSLKTLPEGIVFNNKDYVFLESFTALPILYRGEMRSFEIA